MKTVKLLTRPRNFVVLNPLLAKGGKHEKSNKAKRAQSKQETRREIRGF